MDEAKERGKAPPTGEGVVLLQSTYRHPVQTTLVPHTNVCTYVCGHTRVFPVRALDPAASPPSPTVVVVVVVFLVLVLVVVVPLLIIRMMGRHTLELKLRDVSSVVEIRARPPPRTALLRPPLSFPRRVRASVRASVRARGGFISAFRSSKETAKIRRRIIPPRIGTRSGRFCVKFQARWIQRGR